MTPLNLESAYLQHAPTPAEVGAYLDAAIELLSQTNDARFGTHRTQVSFPHTSATFELRIVVNATHEDSVRLPRIAARIFPEDHPTCRPHQFETVPGFVFFVDGDAIALRHLPRTKEMLSVIQHRLAKTGWPTFVHLAHQVGELQPLTGFYIDRNAAINCCHNYVPVDKDHYPRYLAPLGDCLLTNDTGTLARDVPLYSLRELRRIEDNTYVPLPDEISQMIPDDIYLKEVPHLAVKGTNVGKVAYTENARKGEADVQSVMKPGKYLRRVLKNQIRNDQHLKEMVAELRADSTFDVKVTHDPDEAREVYLTGPDSCLAHGQSRFDETFDLDDEWRHPIEALFWPDGSGTIGLVYVESQGRPAARALINTENKTYPAYYTADWAPAARTALLGWLEENDYSLDEDALLGCRIPRIDLKRDRILCPYIDHGNLGVTIVDEDTLEVGGDLQADYQEGYVTEEDDRIMCDDCEERFDEDEIQYMPHAGHHVCDNCRDDNYVMALDDDGDLEYIHDCNVTHLGFFHRHHGTGQMFECVVEDISQSTLNDHDLCETIDIEIKPMDDCYCVEDTGDWVHGDIVGGYLAAPDTRTPAYMQLEDGTVHEVDDCVWIADESEWVHEDDVDHDTHMTRKEGLHTIAELLDEEAA